MNKKQRTPIHPRNKQKILERDNFKCVNCSASGDFNCLEIDHIINVKDGGTNDDSNLQTLCYRCNMDKYHKKNVTNKYLLDLNPLERLELVKKRLYDYRNLSYSEFKVVFTQDELFKRLRLNLLYLEDLFRDVSGNKKEYYSHNHTEQRDKLLYILKKYTNKTLKELEDTLKDEGIIICYQQIGKILKRVRESDDEDD